MDFVKEVVGKELEITVSDSGQYRAEYSTVGLSNVIRFWVRYCISQKEKPQGNERKELGRNSNTITRCRKGFK